MFDISSNFNYSRLRSSASCRSTRRIYDQVANTVFATIAPHLQPTAPSFPIAVHTRFGGIDGGWFYFSIFHIPYSISSSVSCLFVAIASLFIHW